MSDLVFERAQLAPADSLAAKLIAGDGPVDLPSVAGIGPPLPGPARLPIEAFGTTSADLRAKLERVLAGDGFVVTTGQQPVLCLGPLYVLYKAISAIELAAMLERRLGVPVVPVFWIASDDHDWDEIGQCTFMTAEDETETLHLTPSVDAAGRAAGPSPLGPDISDLIDKVAQLVPQSEFTASYLELLERSYAPETSVSGAFAQTLEGVLRGFEYAWLDSSQPTLKTASVPFFESILDEPEKVLRAMADGAQVLQTAGYEPPIVTIEGGLPLFHDDGSRRQRVMKADDARSFAAGRDNSPEPLEAWSRKISLSPDSFSPNVSSRPVLESWLMPVAATVLGPGEMAYWSQLGPLFDHFGVRFPAVQPRAALQVIEPRTAKALDKLGLSPVDLADGGDAAAARLTAESRPAAVDEALTDLRAALAAGTSSVQEAFAADLPGLKSAAGKTGKALDDAVTQLNRQVDSAVRERQELALSRVRKAAAVLWPGRRPQERVLSPFSFLTRYGDHLIRGAREQIVAWLHDCLAGSASEG